MLLKTFELWIKVSFEAKLFSNLVGYVRVYSNSPLEFHAETLPTTPVKQLKSLKLLQSLITKLIYSNKEIESNVWRFSTFSLFLRRKSSTISTWFLLAKMLFFQFFIKYYPRKLSKFRSSNILSWSRVFFISFFTFCVVGSFLTKSLVSIALTSLTNSVVSISLTVSTTSLSTTLPILCKWEGTVSSLSTSSLSTLDFRLDKSAFYVKSGVSIPYTLFCDRFSCIIAQIFFTVSLLSTMAI